MERFVHRQNIEHYQEMLKTVTDPSQRETIKNLLAEEEAALRKAEEEYIHRNKIFCVSGFAIDRVLAPQL